MPHVTVRKHKTGGNVFVLGRWEMAFGISIDRLCDQEWLPISALQFPEASNEELT